MILIKILFFTSLFIVFYSYLGYGISIWLILKIRKLFHREKKPASEYSFPPVTLITAAFNEENVIKEKIRNTLELDYPSDKLHIVFITDGSSDRTEQYAREFSGIKVMHEPERKGKIAAIHRAMKAVSTPIVIFSDANTLISNEAIKKIVWHYQFPDTGGVAGEKKILSTGTEKVAGAGEGLYWKYESFLKKLDAELYSVVGAAGELFSIRTELYEPVPGNVILDDFIISLNICRKGYRIAYEPAAYAMEMPSASIEEEQKRKVRISAGAFQSMRMMKDLLNIFKYPLLSFQYISHRVLRWTLCPVLLPLIFLLNLLIVWKGGGLIYQLLMAAQVLFYLAAFISWLLSKKHIKIKLLYVPYYFVFQNYCLYLGFIKYLKGKQSVLWEKAERRSYT
jgi:cellulose synthase/poly-beta-1,6-N-acetylglucosamine synthase-like glycosyltransferase